MSDIKIHPDFASMERQLSDEELRHLEQAVMSVGEVVNPLIIWKETGFLIDGHHRYELARAKGIKYTTREISFPSEGAVRKWICNPGLGRRQLTPEDRAAHVEE